MRIRASELTVGDVIKLNDWQLHVLAVEREVGTAVLTAEFDFLLHFTAGDLVKVCARPGEALTPGAGRGRRGPIRHRTSAGTPTPRM